MAQHKVIGKGYPKINSWDIVTGSLRFTADVVNFEKTIAGYIVRSPYPKAKVLRIDTSKAESMEGVYAIITPWNIPKIYYGLLPATSDELVLTDSPAYIGDEIAAIAAIDENTARKAAGLLDIEWDVLPCLLDTETARDESVIRVHDGRENVFMNAKVVVGDAAKAMETSRYSASGAFTTKSMALASVEPLNCLAQWSNEEGLTVWAPVQDPAGTQYHVARLLELPMSRVRIIQTNIGGGFGGKLFTRKLMYICGFLSIRSGRPVYMTHTVGEEICTGRPRVSNKITVQAGIDENGILVANRTTVLADNGAYCSYGTGPVNVMTSRTNVLYKVPDIETRSKLVYTNKVPTSGMRGFGNISMLFALETVMDKLARAANMDPIEFRKKNIYKPGDTSILNWKIGSTRLSDCLDTVAKDAREWRASLPAKQTGTKAIGIGVAGGVHVSSNRTRAFDGSCAQVVIHEDGSVNILSGDGDVGQGIRTVQAMVAAEVLQVDLSRISVKPVDTSYSPHGLGIFADRGTTISCKAVMMAAEDAKRQLIAEGAALLDVRDEHVSYANGVVTAPNGKTATIKDIADFSMWRKNGYRIKGEAYYDPDTVPLDPSDNYTGNPSTGYTFCAIATMIEVDRETGEITLLKISNSHDSGTIINPLIAQGQIQGAVTLGIGNTMMEEIKFDEGKVSNPNLRSYKVPCYLDLPEVKVSFMESYEDTGPFGAKGIGQTGSLLVAPSVNNALYDALGVRVYELPMTPERVWRAINSQKGEEG